MAAVSFIFGFIFLLLGLISLIGYITHNEKMFRKKAKMQQFWGNRLGSIIHFIGYVVIPILVGLYFIFIGPL